MTKFAFNDPIQLPESQRVELLGKLRALVGLSNRERHESNVAYLGIVSELRSRGLPYDYPQKVLDRMREYKEFAEAAPIVENWIAKSFSARDKQIGFSCLVAECLARYISAFRPVSLTTMLHFYHSAPDAFEQSFPGYAENNWCSLLIKR